MKVLNTKNELISLLEKYKKEEKKIELVPIKEVLNEAQVS